MQLLFLFIFMLNFVTWCDDTIMHVRSNHHAKMPLVVVSVNGISSEFSAILSKDLMFSGQFSVDGITFKKLPSKKEIHALFEQQYLLALVVKQSSDKRAIEWWLYDTMSGQLLEGKKYTKKSEHVPTWAHEIADAIWLVLTGMHGPFATKIAYCKTVTTNVARPVQHIYIADIDGSNAQPLVELPTVLVAPRWNSDESNPLVFYSEYTPTNVRLMSVDMHSRRRIASNFDGVNMLPSFSIDGSAVVYCASKGNGSCQIYYYQNGTIKQLTHNTGNNFAPTFGKDNNTIYFCSDFQTGIPHIYVYDLSSNTITQITKGAYCACPSYNRQKNQLLYTRMIAGVMQLCIYDIGSGKQYQLTSDKGNKQECAWSPCGNYILLCISEGGKSQLVVLNSSTGERKKVTADTDICSYPAWSIRYSQFPLVMG